MTQVRQLCYNGVMEQKHVALRVWADTRRIIRICAALSDESICELVHRLATAELARVKAEQE